MFRQLAKKPPRFSLFAPAKIGVPSTQKHRSHPPSNPSHIGINALPIGQAGKEPQKVMGLQPQSPAENFYTSPKPR